MIVALTDTREKLWKIVKGRAIGRNRLTPETIDYLVNRLALRTDLDLRADIECWGMDKSPMGESVSWIRYPSLSY